MSTTISHYAKEARNLMFNEVADWIPRGYASAGRGQEAWKAVVECLDRILELDATVKP